MGKHHDWREDALSISAVWAPSLSCSLSPVSLWGCALIAGFLFVPELCIPYPLLYQHHHVTKTWLIFNWAKLSMELSWILNNPQTHQPQAIRGDISPKSHKVHSILFKTSLEPKVCDTWQMTAPGSHGTRRKSIILHGLDSYFAITTLRMGYIQKLGLLLWNTINAREMRIHPIWFLVSAELVIS